MRIRTLLASAVLLCSSGGLLLALLLTTYHWSLEERGDELSEQALNLVRVDNAEILTSQWLLTLDLILTQRQPQTDLLTRANEQAAAIQAKFADLCGSQRIGGLAQRPANQVAKIDELLTTAARANAALPNPFASLPDHIEALSAALQESSAHLRGGLETQLEIARQDLAEDRERYAQTSVALTILYSIGALLIWAGLSRRLVTPIQLLAKAADKSAETDERVLPEGPAPREVRLLYESIDGFMARLRRSRANAEDALAKSESNATALEVVFNSVTDAIISTDEKGVILHTNRSASRIFCNRFAASTLRRESLPTAGNTLSNFFPIDDVLAHLLESEVAEPVILAQEIETWAVIGGPDAKFPLSVSATAYLIDDEIRITWIVRDVTNRRRAQEELEEKNRQLVEASRFAGMAEIANGVLHNIGNALNSVSVATELVFKKLKRSRISKLAKVGQVLREQEEHLASYLANDPKGKQVPAYLVRLTEALQEEHSELQAKVDIVKTGADHMKEIINLQQSYAGTSGVSETMPVDDVVSVALRMSQDNLAKHQVEVIFDERSREVARLDKHKTIQILVNLIKNSVDAMNTPENSQRKLTLATVREGEQVEIRVTDSGTGISEDSLERIFQHGFTTKQTGHGFGLHSAANSAREMDGRLSAASNGVGCGATFTLELPIAKEGVCLA